jgi:hypothetical protein
MRLIRWVVVVTLGEAVGFTVAAAVGVAVTGAMWGPLATLVAMVLAGSVEGALLGAAQADCLYRWRHESMWGNTEEVAPAIAAGLRELMEVTLAEVGAATAVQVRKSG